MTISQIANVDFRELMASLNSGAASVSSGLYARNAANATPLGYKSSTCGEGERNNRIASLAGKWFRHGSTADEVVILALAENSNFNPPLDDAEVIATCDSIARTHQRNNISATPVDEAGLTPLFSVDAFRARRYFNSAPPPRRWLINGVIPCGKVCLLIAPGGTGKSMFAMQLGVSCATGVPFADTWEVGERGGVLLLLGEDDDEELHRRTLNNAEQLALNGDREVVTMLGENLIIKSMVGDDNLLTATEPSTREVRQTVLVKRLILTAQQVPNLKLIVIDPASRFRGGDENASQDATRFVEAVECVAQATGAAVLIIHHANKGSMNANEQNQSASRGSSALTDGVRLQMNLATFDKNTAKEFGIAEDQRKNFLTLSVTKSNYSAPQPDIALRRAEGGYLVNACLKSVKLQDIDDLQTGILKLVKEEATAGRRYSKTAFTSKFGGENAVLKAGNNKVRDAVSGLIDAGKLTLDRSKKLAVPWRKSQKA